METSTLFAKFMGPVMLVGGIAMLANRKHMVAIAEDLLASPALIYLAGVLALLLGLTVVIFHNVWTAGWPVIITVYGWIALVAGVVRMVFPALVKKMGGWIMMRDVFMTVAGIINVGLGAFLVWMGFGV